MQVGVESLGGLRILLAEDELLVALSLQEILKELGCEVVGPKARIEDAIEAAKTEAIDGAILDVNLRGHPVYPVATALQERGVPFIFSTGYGSSSVLLKDFRGVPVLEKPYEAHRLRELVYQTFSGNRRAPVPVS